jgi:DNA-binding transcriptional LysR family regulator
MKTDLADLPGVVAVARARGFRDAARATGTSAPGLSEAVRRLKTPLGVGLVNSSGRLSGRGPVAESH